MSFGSKISTCDSASITNDFLVSFVSLEKIIRKMQTCNDGDEKLSKMLSKLLTIVKSFNTNVKHINNQIQTLDFPEFQSFEDYCNEKDFVPDNEAKDNYNDAKALFDFEQCKELHERSKLQQLAYICPSLTQKITGVFDQLGNFESIAKQSPSYNLEALIASPFFAPTLRIIDDSDISSSSSGTTTPIQLTTSSSDVADNVASTTFPSSSSEGATVSSDPTSGLSTAIDPSLTITAPEVIGSTPSSETSESVPVPSSTNDGATLVVGDLSSPVIAKELVEPLANTTIGISTVNEPTPPVATTIGFNVKFDLDSEQTLGICCEPNWTSEPIVCAKNGKADWSGQAPIGKEWKFVILQSGCVHKWEHGANRRYDAPTDTSGLQVRF